MVSIFENITSAVNILEYFDVLVRALNQKKGTVIPGGNVWNQQAVKRFKWQNVLLYCIFLRLLLQYTCITPWDLCKYINIIPRK